MIETITDTPCLQKQLLLYELVAVKYENVAVNSNSSSPPSQSNFMRVFIARYGPARHDAASGASAPLVCAASSDPGRNHVLICPIFRISHVSACQEQAIVGHR
jgi:hypothetical protein